MRKCIVLNKLELTPTKQKVLDSIFREYLDILKMTFSKLEDARTHLELHHLTYKEVRQASFLASDIVQEARKDVWANRKTIKRGFFSCSIRLNKRWFKYIKTARGNPCFIITYAAKKRLAIPIAIDKQFLRFQAFLQKGWSFDNVSLLKNGRVSVVLEREFLDKHDNITHSLGVDVGSSTLAAITLFNTKTSRISKQLYLGRDVAIRQRKYINRRSKLQSLAKKGSDRAKKSLMKLRRKQNNFVKTRSGQIAKEIVELARTHCGDIVIERLKNIRGKRKSHSKKINQKINSIPYAKFKEYLNSNCEMSGVHLFQIDPYHTSRWCPCCGAINDGHCHHNRALYKCTCCGLDMNSDRKASLAIAIKPLLERKKQQFQISKRRVPVNGLLRSDEAAMSFAVQHLPQPMKSHH